MKIHEFQAKHILRQFGVRIPRGEVAETPNRAREIAEKIGPRVVVKAQIHAGGRGKGGGVKLAATPDEAEKGAERVRQKLDEYCTEFEGPDLGKKLSVSVGIAGSEEHMAEAKDMLTAADNAMYKAKEKGGNCCVTLQPSPAGA